MKQSKTGDRTILYYLVAIYIGYMGYLVLKNRLSGDETLPFPIAIAASSVLIIGAVGIICYAVVQNRKSGKQKKIEQCQEEDTLD